jgi:biotin carboxylase
VKTIIILGAGTMQEPAIRIAKRKGWNVVLADGNPGAAARGLADSFECVDLKDRDGLLSLAQRQKESGGLDGIFTAGTDFSSSVAWVAERLGLPGISFDTAMKATDKCLMRGAFTAAGVPSPRSVCWPGTGDPRAALAEGMSFPLVVKPVDNMGARGVRRVDEASALEEACRAALLLSRSSRVIIEEYMEGPEFSLDAIVHDGRAVVCGVADRIIRFPPYFVEMGHTMPTDFPPSAVREIESVFLAGIRAIGIHHGAAKGDIKLTPKGAMVGEIAARLSGGYMSGWTFPLASGVEVTEAALNLAVGLPPGDLSPKWSKVCAERALISIPGIVETVWGVEEAARAEGVRNVFVRTVAGDRVVFPANNVQKCGNVLAVAGLRQEAGACASRALALLQLRLRPLEASTTAYLRERLVHLSFDSLPDRLRESIKAMPVFRGDPLRLDPSAPIRIVPLAGWDPCAAEDWHGLEFSEAVRLACQRGGAELPPPGGGQGAPFAIGRAFWNAMQQGSHQAGVYVLDSVREAARRGALPQFLGDP